MSTIGDTRRYTEDLDSKAARDVSGAGRVSGLERQRMLPNKCGHGKTWNQECVECEIVWLQYTVKSFGPKVTEARKKLAELKRRTPNPVSRIVG